MKKIITFLAVIILIAAITSAFADVGYIASGGGGYINVFRSSDWSQVATIPTGAGVDGVSFAPNGDLYCSGHWSNNVYKAAYLGNGTWEATAALYASIPDTHGTQTYNYAFVVAAKDDGTVFVGSYDTGIYKIAPDKTVT